MSDELATRNDYIFQRWLRGASCAKIAKTYDLTETRIQQVISARLKRLPQDQAAELLRSHKVALAENRTLPIYGSHTSTHYRRNGARRDPNK